PGAPGWDGKIVATLFGYFDAFFTPQECCNACIVTDAQWSGWYFLNGGQPGVNFGCFMANTQDLSEICDAATTVVGIADAGRIRCPGGTP
ncbi:9924_t:CDS:1, partial [Paraglomus occultum]